jgi:hypothetical protein
MFLEDLFSALEIKVPSVTDDLYLLALQYGSRKFFMETEVWNVPLDFIPVGASAILFELDPPEETMIHAIHSVIVDGEPLDSASFETIRKFQQYQNMPTAWFRQGLNMHIAPCPTRAFDLEVKAVLVPVREHFEIAADEYAEKYSDGIVFAAAVHLMEMPNKPWTNARSARTHEINYQESKLIARREALGYLDKQSSMLQMGTRYASKVKSY